MARGGRKSRRRFRLLPTVLLTVAILGLPTIVYAWGRTSSSFAIDRVVVTGTRLVPRARAQRLLRRAYLTHNLFTVTAADVRGTLKGECYVAAVQIDRDFPDTLRVRVVEHQPAAYLLAGGRWYVLSEDCFVICELGAKGKGTTSAGSGSGGGRTEASASPSPEASPSPSATASTSAAAGGEAASGGQGGTLTPAALQARLLAGPGAAARLRLPRLSTSVTVRAGRELDDRSVQRLLAVRAALPASLRATLAAVWTSAGGSMTLRFKPGPRVVWGDSGRPLAKTLALRAVLARYAAAGQEATFLDVSVPDRVLGKPVLK